MSSDRMMTTPVAPFLDPSSDEFLDDPHTVYDRLRPISPVVRDPIGWSSIDYATCAEAFTDRALVPGIDPLLESRGIEALWGEQGRTLTDSEGDDHRRLRRVIGPWFGPRRLEQLRRQVRSLATELLASAEPDAPFDVMADYADVVPSRVFCWMIGAPDADAPRLAALSKTLLRVFTATDEMVEPVRSAKIEMAEFTRDLIADRSTTPGDDLVSVLLDARDAGDLDDGDVFYLVEELLSASVDNTANTTGLAVWTLLDQPGAWRHVGEDELLTEAATEECGRLEPAIRHTIKYAIADTVIGDVEVSAGEFVTVRVAGAHRDPAVFHDPHRFDLERVSAKPQLAFGMGRHFCLGAALGRIEINEMVRVLCSTRPEAQIGETVSMSKNEAGLVHRLDLVLGARR